jgi:hypothetical protein
MAPIITAVSSPTEDEITNENFLPNSCGAAIKELAAEDCVGLHADGLRRQEAVLRAPLTSRRASASRVTGEFRKTQIKYYAGKVGVSRVARIWISISGHCNEGQGGEETVAVLVSWPIGLMCLDFDGALFCYA